MTLPAPLELSAFSRKGYYIQLFHTIITSKEIIAKDVFLKPRCLGVDQERGDCIPSVDMNREWIR